MTVISVIGGQNSSVTNPPGGITPSSDTVTRGFAPNGVLGSAITATTLSGVSMWQAQEVAGFGNTVLVIGFAGNVPQSFFQSVVISGQAVNNPSSPHTYTTATAAYAAQGSTVSIGGFTVGAGDHTCWAWVTTTTPTVFPNFAMSSQTDMSFAQPVMYISGQGDITDPGAWEDSSGNIPPLSFQNVPQTVNYPLNGDGRYWFIASANAPTPEPITFIGDSAFRVAGDMSLQTTITQAATDGSELWVAYALDGATFTTLQLGPSLQSAPDIPSGPISQSKLSNQLVAPLAGATNLVVKVFTTLGTADPTKTPWNVAVAITRNSNERIPWDYPNPFDPISYNCECVDDVTPTDTLMGLRTKLTNRLGFKVLLAEVPGLTLLQLQTYLLQRIGFSSQAANPPPGMASFCTAIINEAQQDLYRRYAQDAYTADTAPALLVNAGDTVTLDNEAIKLLAVAKAKAHYGAADAAVVQKAFEQYLQDLYTRQPPNLTNILNDFLIEGQKYLYRRYNQLHTRRMFRWKVNPGQRFYSLKDNDEDVLCNYQMDPLKQIEWAGIQDTRNVWYPLIEGIPPQLYTMIDKPWRPARYEIRQCIEVYPAPDQTYWMWMKAHFGLRTFAADSDQTTIDAELLFLHALANAKAHYKQPDASNVESMANNYRKELIAGTHGTKKYIPGTIAVPPAVRPTLIQYQDNQGG